MQHRNINVYFGVLSSIYGSLFLHSLLCYSISGMIGFQRNSIKHSITTNSIFLFRFIHFIYSSFHGLQLCCRCFRFPFAVSIIITIINWTWMAFADLYLYTIVVNIVWVLIKFNNCSRKGSVFTSQFKMVNYFLCQPTNRKPSCNAYTLCTHTT